MITSGFNSFIYRGASMKFNKIYSFAELLPALKQLGIKYDKARKLKGQRGFLIGLKVIGTGTLGDADIQALLRNDPPRDMVGYVPGGVVDRTGPNR
jgi:hypothetical protein